MPRLVEPVAEVLPLVQQLVHVERVPRAAPVRTVDQMNAAAPTASSPMSRKGSTTVMGSFTTA